MEPALPDDVVAAVINYNTAELTAECVRSLLDTGVQRILVLDNGSANADFERLRSQTSQPQGRVRVIRSEENLGFAPGSNFLIEEALRDTRCRHVLLVNSDAVVDAKGLEACLQAMRDSRHDLMGGRMLKPPIEGQAPSVDSLGITLYKCLLASNRQSTADAYLGPTGGFAIYSRAFLEEVKQLHGHVFDPAFFCYAEDTDLCVRARLLRFSVGYCDQAVAYHAGQASTSGEYNDFILYHGIRNSIWMAAKSLPLSILLTHLPWVVLLHGGIVLRHALQGRWRTLWRLYRDALCGLPRVLRDRRLVQRSRRVSAAEFRSHIDRQFYERRFLEGAIGDLFRRS